MSPKKKSQSYSYFVSAFDKLFAMFAPRVFFWNQKVKHAPIQWWLVITRNVSSGDIKYFFSNISPCASTAHLVRTHRHRYWIERNFQDAKTTSVGMAQYQVRCWHGWHHHMSFCMVAMLFMLEIKVTHTGDDKKPTSQTIVFCMSFLLAARIQSVNDLDEVITTRYRKIKNAEKSALRCQKRNSPQLAVGSLQCYCPL